jgi:RNA polymerase sigma-70 factor (ECF subfamily)
VSWTNRCVFMGEYARFRQKRAQGCQSVWGVARFDPLSPVCQNSLAPAVQHDRPSPAGDITRLLHEWQAGERESLDQLITLVYRELHLMASRLMAREWRKGTIQTTGLVNEAYVKLVDQRAVDWQGRAHFFAIEAQVMRRILLDAARHRLREKRGGGTIQIAIDDVPVAAEPSGLDAIDVLAIDRALHDLEQLDPDQAKMVELRFFGGLTVEETSAVLGVSPATVKREWAVAKAWLYRALTTRPGEPRR